MTETTVDGVRIESTGDALHLVLDRPDRKNALDPPATARLVGALDASLAAAMETEANALELSARAADYKERLTAFREKRAPRFAGR